MAGQYISDASGYGATEFDTKIPSLSDQANIVEAFKLYHYGLDNYTGGEAPASDSVHAHLEGLADRVTTLETVPVGVTSLTGTENEITVSAASGAVVVGLPDDVLIGSDLTVSHNLAVGGNLTVSGSTTFVNTQSLSVTDPIILLATNNSGNTLDIGLSGKYVSSASTLYTGLVRDESDSVWKLFSAVSASPSTQVNFTGATFDGLKIGSLDSQSIISSGTITGVSLIGTGASDIRLPINAQTGTSYTTVLSDVGKIVEMNNASGNTFTVPTNSSVPYAIGSQIVVVQTGSGQTTIVAAGGVTVNGTPGLKLRAQWSSGTLIKRGTDTWVLVGDLVA
jgi:hypothetical protein